MDEGVRLETACTGQSPVPRVRIPPPPPVNAGVAQPAEHGICNPRVRGSSPLAGSLGPKNVWDSLKLVLQISSKFQLQKFEIPFLNLKNFEKKDNRRK